MLPRYTQPLTATPWNNVATGVNTPSASLRLYNCIFVSAFGNVSAATTITLALSSDGQNWYAGPNVVLAGAGNFSINAEVGAEYVALQSSANVTATGIISAK